MRFITIIIAIALALGAASAYADERKWIIKGADAIGCQTEQAIRQLHTMAVLPAALEMARASKIDSGECKSLPAGEVLTLVTKTAAQGLTVHRVRRPAGELLYVSAGDIGPTL